MAVHPHSASGARGSRTGNAKQKQIRQQVFFSCGLTLREVLFSSTDGRTGSETLSTMSGSREEERRKLADIINHWNANRLDLFEISRPTEVGDQPGVAGEAADPQAPLLGECETVKPPLADAWVGNVEKPSCCGQRGLLGLLRDGPDLDKTKVVSASKHSINELLGPGILPHHCNLMHSEGMVTVTPHGPDADTFVDGQRDTETTVLRPGSTLQLGSAHVLMFVDPMFDQGGKREPVAMMRSRHKSGSVPETTFDLHGDVHSGAALPTSKSSGKLEMERGMVKPMIRGEQQDSRSQDISADRTELTLPASIEFRDNSEDTFAGHHQLYQQLHDHFKLAHISFPHGLSPRPVTFLLARHVTPERTKVIAITSQEEHDGGVIQSGRPSVNWSLTSSCNMWFSVVGRRDQGAGQEKLGIYIKSVVKGGAADMDGRLAAGDQLLSVDGRSLVGLSQERAAELMTRTGSVVTLEVAKQGAIYHGLATLLNQPSPMMQR
ncbi:afadin, partial [Lates japonicus]